MEPATDTIAAQKRMPSSVTLGKLACALMLASGILVWAWMRSVFPPGYEAILDALLLTGSVFLVSKALLSLLYTPANADVVLEGARISAVIACHNEDPDILQTLLGSLRHQEYALFEVIVVDDGSTDARTCAFFDGFSDESGFVTVHRFAENQGKIAALDWGIREAAGDFLLLTDADGLIERDVARKLIAPFSDERVGAVCGRVTALNRTCGLLTRMQGLIYDSAYYLGRGAQSVTGSVIVCSGALSMYRAEALEGELGKLTNYFGGKHTRFTGDDSALTGIVLGKGYKTAYQSDAVCLTTVPTTLRAFVKQQVRWTRDAYTAAFEFVPSSAKQPCAMAWHFAEGFLWIIMLGALAGVLMSFQLLPTLLTFATILFYIAASATISMAYSIDEDRVAFFTCIFFSLLFEALLFTVRVTALATVIRSKWR